MNNKEFGNKIRIFRFKNGITQQKFSIVCGIHQTTLSHIEQGIATKGVIKKHNDKILSIIEKDNNDCYIKGNFIILKNIKTKQYSEIGVDQIKNEKEMLNMVFHLSTKIWVTTEHIYKFINLYNKELKGRVNENL